MCNCAYYKINFTGLLKILIKLHKISAKYYENNNMEIWVCNRCVEGRGKRGKARWKSVDCREGRGERGEYNMVCWGYLRCPLRTLRSSYNQIVHGSRIYATVV